MRHSMIYIAIVTALGIAGNIGHLPVEPVDLKVQFTTPWWFVDSPPVLDDDGNPTDVTEEQTLRFNVPVTSPELTAFCYALALQDPQTGYLIPVEDCEGPLPLTASKMERQRNLKAWHKLHYGPRTA